MQALKVYIKSQLPLITEKAEVLVCLEALPTRKPPLADPDAIDLYDDALKEVLPVPQQSWGRIIGGLRCQSVKLAPKNEALGKQCLKVCLLQGDLDHSRQESCPAMHLNWICILTKRVIDCY